MFLMVLISPDAQDKKRIASGVRHVCPLLYSNHACKHSCAGSCELLCTPPSQEVNSSKSKVLESQLRNVAARWLAGLSTTLRNMRKMITIQYVNEALPTHYRE